MKRKERLIKRKERLIKRLRIVKRAIRRVRLRAYLIYRRFIFRPIYWMGGELISRWTEGPREVVSARVEASVNRARRFLRDKSYDLAYWLDQNRRRRAYLRDDFENWYWRKVEEIVTCIQVLNAEIPRVPFVLAETVGRMRDNVRALFSGVSWHKPLVRALYRLSRVYFFFVNFRRIMVGLIIADRTHYHWSKLTMIQPLRPWYLGLIGVVACVMWILMDAADRRVTLDSHDLFTRAFISAFMKSTPLKKKLTIGQSDNRVLYWYVRLRDRRNFIIALAWFLFFCEPGFNKTGRW